MTNQFQLTCKHCNHPLVVELRHAGNSIECGNCQRPIEVPKLRDLKRLEPVDAPSPVRPEHSWGQLSGGLFVLGVLLLAIAIGSCIYLQVKRQQWREYTEKPVIEGSNFSLDGATLTDTWQFWNSLLEVTDVSLRNEPVFIQAREAVKRLDFWSKIFYGVATVGIFFATCALFCRPRKES